MHTHTHTYNTHDHGVRVLSDRDNLISKLRNSTIIYIHYAYTIVFRHIVVLYIII